MTESSEQQNDPYLLIDSQKQRLYWVKNEKICNEFRVSTGKNGLGETLNSECTPRGWHAVHAIHGLHYPVNAVFVARKWTGELYSPALGALCGDRDWILTRIIQLDGLEPGRNRGGEVDTLNRHIYIHGTPHVSSLGTPGSRGCIRMSNEDLIVLAEWVSVGTRLCVQ